MKATQRIPGMIRSTSPVPGGKAKLKMMITRKEKTHIDMSISLLRSSWIKSFQTMVSTLLKKFKPNSSDGVALLFPYG